jgi:two-component system, cell cycle response regulator
MLASKSIVLVDPSDPSGGSVLAGRLRMQGYNVVEASSSEEGARCALASKPAAVVADLWMPKISGVQLCRLLNMESATRDIPVLLRGPEGQRNRFWAERAGASAYVVKGRMGELVRALARAISTSTVGTSHAEVVEIDDVRDRIADYLDQALFESVIAGEVRALGSCGDFDRLIDLLSQLVARLTSYRWLAVSTQSPPRFGLHVNPRLRAQGETEARAALGMTESAHLAAIEDDDAYPDTDGPRAIVRPIHLGGVLVGQIALAVRAPEHPKDAALVEVIARELAGPIRIATLVEESQRLASVDALTGLMNRRAFLEGMRGEVARAKRHGHALAMILLDVDHFKLVNDDHGHASGDAVLSAVGKLLGEKSRAGDLVARWGGEEFVLALHATNLEGALTLAERQRQALETLAIVGPAGNQIPVTASFGVAQFRSSDEIDVLIDRADRAMYFAKSSGRNRVASEAETPREVAAEILAAE